jgi:peptide/nickel transport system ATP-binding protein
MNPARPRLDEPLLRVDGLSIEIDVPAGALHAVTDVSFVVRKGETLCLVGESGCGKTMTALALMRLLPRAATVAGGRIAFEGRDLLALSDAEMAALRGDRLGIIFQDPMTSLNPVFTIGNQLEEVHRRHRNAGRREARERAEYLLQRIGIMSPRLRLSQYPHQLSGGLRQRMMIAMALMCGPSLIIADEPTTALDVTVQVQILRLLTELQREFKMALILITHNLGVVARVADRVAVMYGGRIVEAGSAAHIFGDPSHPYTRALLACVPVPGRPNQTGSLGSIPGIVPSLIGDVRGCAFRNRCRHALPACAEAEIPVREAAANHAVRCVLDPAVAAVP